MLVSSLVFPLGFIDKISSIAVTVSFSPLSLPSSAGVFSLGKLESSFFAASLSPFRSSLVQLLSPSLLATFFKLFISLALPLASAWASVYSFSLGSS